MKVKKFFQDPLARRIFFATGASLALAGLGIGLYAALIETRRYELDSIRIDTGKPARQSGGLACEPQRLRILHISDLHLSYPESHKLDFLARVTEAAYDLIVITGDIFEDYSGLAYAEKIISCQPRLGTFAVLGNHDCYDFSLFNRTVGKVIKKWRFPAQMRDVKPMLQALTGAGIHVLRNSALCLAGEKLHIIGIDYPDISDKELAHLVSQAEPDSFLLVLCHLPSKLERLAKAGVHLALCGHTHGGQVRLPFLGPLTTDSELARAEASGLIWRGDTAIHVSRGLGADPRTDFRLLCRPHASLIEVCHHRSV